MRNLYCLLILLCMGIAASSQRVYFVYLQTENGSPFYVKLADRIYSSTASGYLILPHLSDSTYQLAIGFAASKEESKFMVPVSGRDRGFLIRHFDFGTGLFDLQSLTIIRPLADQSRSGTSYIQRNDSFTSLLAKASGDTSLLYVAVPVKEDLVKKEIKPITPAPEEPKPDHALVQVKDSTAIEQPVQTLVVETPANRDSQLALVDTTLADTAPVPVIETKDSVNSLTDARPVDASPDSLAQETVVPYKKSSVKKHSESSTSEGFGLVFYDTDETGTDTIRLLIPNPRIIFKQPDTTESEDHDLFLRIDRDSLQRLDSDSVRQNRNGAQNEAPVISKMIPRATCTAHATDADFRRLRKNMAARETDEEMVDEAKKFFRTKCFTTEQIRNLSVLFLTSAGKYQFFDAAYTHVSDQDQFPSLGSEIRDEYYIRRFKALIGE